MRWTSEPSNCVEELCDAGLTNTADLPLSGERCLPNSPMGLEFPLTEIYPSGTWRGDPINENDRYDTAPHKPVKLPTPVGVFETQSVREVSATRSPSAIILDLLRSCRVSRKRARRPSCLDGALESLESRRIMNIIKADSFLVARCPGKLLNPLLDKWNIEKSLSLPVLGLPARWKGIQAAVEYLRLLDANTLDHIPRRLGYLLLYLNYKQLCEKSVEHYPLIPGKSKMTSLLVCILDHYHDDPLREEPPQTRRNRLTTYHLRRGQWWWRLASNYGVGVCLTADNGLMKLLYVILHSQ